jgi:thiol-disulfide isomerase/thioredoxin
MLFIGLNVKIIMTKITITLSVILAFMFFGRVSAQVPVMDFNGFEPYLHKQNDTTYIINFWATWCVPCVKELPAFEELNEKYSNEKVKVLLVSLDFVKHYDTKLLPFIEERKIKSEVILLNDPRSNLWIDKVSPDWSGAIPATLIYKGKKRKFYEQSFSFESLEKELLKYLK